MFFLSGVNTGAKVYIIINCFMFNLYIFLYGLG